MQKMQHAKVVHSAKHTYQIGKLKINARGKSSFLLIVTLACLVFGILVGGLSLHVLTQNDCFYMVANNGQVDWEIGAESSHMTYEELGIKCVAFGQDVTDSITIKYLYREDIHHDIQEVSGVNPDKVGFYYVVYTSSNIKYRTVQLVRNVIVVGGEQ